MINRSLIRIKTVQILYSYLLARSDFKLAPAPDSENSTRDRRFAYFVYLDVLGLIIKLSSVAIPGGGFPAPSDAVIKKNGLGRALYANPAVRDALAPIAQDIAGFDALVPEIMAAIASSKAYEERKHKRKLSDTSDSSFWIAIITEVLRKNKALENHLRKHELYSHVGFDMGMNLLSTTLSGFEDSKASYSKAIKDLDDSLLQAYNLYHAILLIPSVMTDIQQERLERAKNKYLPSDSDTNPNTRLIDNLYVKTVEEDKYILDYLSKHPDADPRNWPDFDVLAANLLDVLTQSELYANYLETEPGDYAVDAAFWRDALRTIILPSDELLEVLENKSVFWNDDLNVVSDFALKTILRSYKNLEPDEVPTITLMPRFMNEQDERFGAELFEYVVENRMLYRKYINEFIDSRTWDTERIAFMDIVIIMTAIAEIINFPSIPVPASVNEYVEIANDYSTARSGQFVNGILASIIAKLNKEGIIDK